MTKREWYGKGPEPCGDRPEPLGNQLGTTFEKGGSDSPYAAFRRRGSGTSLAAEPLEAVAVFDRIASLASLVSIADSLATSGLKSRRPYWLDVAESLRWAIEQLVRPLDDDTGGET